MSSVETFKSLLPDVYYKSIFDNNIRPDGRELFEMRPIAISAGTIKTANGSALVKCGNTTVVCGITAELSIPKVTEPNFGFLVPNVDMPPLCSPTFKPGPPSEQAQVATQFLADVLINSKCIHLPDLCVNPGKLVWTLYINVTCLNYDGNINDASVMATVSALKNCKLPTVVLDDESDKFKVDFSRETSVPVKSVPVGCTVAFLDEKTAFVDCSAEEEPLVSTVVTVVTVENQVIMTYKPGGCGIAEDQIHKCTSFATKQGSIVRQLIGKSVVTS